MNREHKSLPKHGQIRYDLWNNTWHFCISCGNLRVPVHYSPHGEPWCAECVSAEIRRPVVDSLHRHMLDSDEWPFYGFSEKAYAA